MASLLEKELSAVKDIGFKNKEEFIEEAVKTYLASRKDIRINLASVLYREGKISLGKAKEISGLDIEEFKKELKLREIVRKKYNTKDSLKNILDYRGN